jgi:hypothetical protein
VRNLPASAAPAALDPVVAPAQAGLDLQEDLEHRGIGLGDEFALPEMTAGFRIERIEPNTTIAELLIDCEEDRSLRAVLVGMLREADRPR